jgi:heme-degrading monooxygenase HmoA
MHAGVNYLQVQPGKMDEVVSIFRDSVIPASRPQKGFKGVFVLTDRSTDRAIAIGLWETEADLPAVDETGGYYQEQIAKLAQLIASPPVRELYEVGVRVEATSGGFEHSYARLGTTQIQPGKMAEFISVFRDSMVPPAQAQKGFKGVMVLANDDTSKSFGFSLWETEADARTMETSSAAFQAQADKVRDIIAEVPPIEYFEVSLHV